MYRKTNFKDGFVPLEQEIAALWKEKNIVAKSLARNPQGKHFTFYDGPPTANGKPHIGHVLTRAIKDIIPRYKVMQGYQVLRKAGWDTHGLPVELEVEKKLGITGKAGIEAYGVEKFIGECKQSVFTYVSLWEEMSEKVAFWVDMDHPYVTYHNNYIESVWWALGQMWDKGLIYKGHKVMPYCPRCGTSLSSHEVAQGYKDIKDVTVISKFKIKNRDNTFILAWTTTPWTLPSNTALTVNRGATYVEAAKGDEVFIVAKDLATKVLGEDHTILKEFLGQTLLGTAYEQLLPFVQPEGKAFVVIHGDYVTTGDGTGIVHTAPAYGEDDQLVSKANGIATLHLVDTDGTFLPAVTPFAGMNVRDANPKIVDYLRENGKLFHAEKFLHSYPHCWRCDTPLLYYPKDSWFIRSTAYREELMNSNSQVNWYPENIGTGRMGKFLEGVIDWSISRDRYWGTPLPIWECDCGHREMVGSIEKLKEMAVDCPENIELHKPFIDAVHLTCPQCQGTMTRTHEVIDCWFDSGSMPFAQHHYPFENKELFAKTFPAQFISEAIDQTRGWFYTLLNISTAVFERPAFENCIVMGHVLDAKGQKMSKSKGNSIEPNEILNQTGADAVRWFFYAASAPWVSKRLSLDDVLETQRKFILTLSNVYSFYLLYAELDQFNPLDYADFKPTHVMDRWILSKMNSMIAQVEEKLDGYQITQAALSVGRFVDELSNWYVRRNRARFWQGELNDDKVGAFTTLYTVLVTLSSVLAPFIPFFSEEIYQSLVVSLDPDAPESVHLSNWVSANPAQMDGALEAEMDGAYALVRLGRSARNGANIKNRQPLSNLLVSAAPLPGYYQDIVRDELNIKTITFGADLSGYVNFEIKPNLPVLGREFGRFIPQIKAELAKHNSMELAGKIEAGEAVEFTVGETLIRLSKENLLVTMNGGAGFAFAGDGDTGVVLDTTITPDLLREGYLREMLSKIQNMRKDSGLAVSDHIHLHFAGDDQLIALIGKEEGMICRETLADAVFYNDQTPKTGQKINGKLLEIGLTKAE